MPRLAERAAIRDCTWAAKSTDAVGQIVDVVDGKSGELIRRIRGGAAGDEPVRHAWRRNTITVAQENTDGAVAGALVEPSCQRTHAVPEGRIAPATC